MSDQQTPPVAGERPYSFTRHGITVEDPWHWLRDPDYPNVNDADVLAYLAAENEYFEARMSPYKELTDSIFEEIKGREQPDLSSVPWKRGGWYYHWSYEEGSQYRTWRRWPASDPNAREAPTDNAQTILDEPVLAGGLEYFNLGAMSVSNDGDMLAYSTDTDGSERYTIAVKDLTTGDLLKDKIENTAGGVVWATDDTCFFYVVLDENWRPYQVRLHTLGEPVESDSVIYAETDPGFFVGLSRTSSEEYVVISAGDHVTSEARLIPASDPGSQPVLVSPRRTGHEYWVDHQGDRFVIRTNDTHKNSRLVTAPADDPTEKSWESLVDASDSNYIRGFDVFEDFIAVQERIDGLDHIRLLDRANESTYIDFSEEAYVASLGNNPEFRTNTLRLGYSSMVTPDTVFDYHLNTGELESRKVRQIPSGYDATEYVVERVLAPARDGVRVPASIVRRKDTLVDGTAPVYLYSYGAYGFAFPPSFSTSRLSLLDRGFIFVIAHIRGGDDLGYHWYEAGKLDRRTNTFNDFVDVARYLIEQGIRGGRSYRYLGSQRRGPAHGRRGEPGSRTLGRRRRSCPFRGCSEHDTGRNAAPHANRVAGVGQSDRGQVRISVHQVILAIRPVEETRLSLDARDRRTQRPQGDLLGTGQVRGETANIEDRRQSAAAQDQHGRGARRQIREIRKYV